MPVRNHGELGVFFSLITHINVCNVHLNNRGRQRARTQEEKKGEVGKTCFGPFPSFLSLSISLGFFPTPCESEECFVISMRKGSRFA